MANKPIFIGIDFPYNKGSYGLPKTLTNEDLIKSDLMLLLNTRRGERVMMPDYGLDLERFIFDNTGPLLNAKIYREIITTISNFEPRVSVVSIEVNEEKNLVDIKIVYEVNGLLDNITITRNKEGV